MFAWKDHWRYHFRHTHKHTQAYTWILNEGVGKGFHLFLIYFQLTLSLPVQSYEVLHGGCFGWHRDVTIPPSPGGERYSRVLKYFHAVLMERASVSLLMEKSRDSPPFYWAFIWFQCNSWRETWVLTETLVDAGTLHVVCANPPLQRRRDISVPRGS